MAEGFAAADANIIGVSAIEKAVTAPGRTFAAYPCDFSDREAVKAFAARVPLGEGGGRAGGNAYFTPGSG